MNKMLQALKQLQADSEAAVVSAERTKPSAEMTRPRKVSSESDNSTVKQAPAQTTTQPSTVRATPATRSTSATTAAADSSSAGSSRKFDVSAWQSLTANVPVMRVEQAKAVSVQAPNQPAELPPAKEKSYDEIESVTADVRVAESRTSSASAPVVPSRERYESPWERSARQEFSDPGRSEGYRAVWRTWREELPGNFPRAVLIAGIGCTPSDVSEFVLRLGMIEASEQTNILLVDAEPDRWLSNALVAYDQPGLREAFAENLPPRHFVVQTHTPHLQFLPAGILTGDFERSPTRMARQVEQMKGIADWTILAAADGCSPLATDLARACDAVYLLVRLGTATSAEAAQIRQHLHAAGGRLLGCIALQGEGDD